MSIMFYKTLHIIGIGLVFLALGSALQSAALDIKKVDNPWKKSTSILHGVALLIILVSGFGMLAKLGVQGFPIWIIIKLLAWAFIGYAIAFHKKGPGGAKVGRILVIIALFVATYFGLNH